MFDRREYRRFYMMKVVFLACSVILTAAMYPLAEVTTLGGFTDTYLVMNKDSTPETQPLLIVEGYDCSACVDQRALFNFDLSGFAGNAAINKAELMLYSPSQPRPGAANVRVYKITKAWDGAEANWEHATRSTKWQNSGCDFEATPLASLRYTDKINVWHTYDITEIIKGFVANPATNFGVMLKMDAVMNTVAYVSSDAPQTELRPKLVVDYVQGSAVTAARHSSRQKSAGFRIVNSHVQLSFTEAGLHLVQIGTLDGAVVFKAMVSGRNPELVLGSINSGTYFIQAAGSGEELRQIFSIVR